MESATIVSPGPFDVTPEEDDDQQTCANNHEDPPQGTADGNFGSDEIADENCNFGLTEKGAGPRAGVLRKSPSTAHNVDVPICLEFVGRATADRTLRGDMAAADTDLGSDSLFAGWNKKLSGSLNAAYPIFLDLLAGGEGAVAELLKHPCFDPAAGPRKRKPSAKNPALIALEFVARPQDMPQRKACSEYTAMLVCAAVKRIAPVDFVEDMQDVPLCVAKACVRALKKPNLAILEQQKPPSALSGTDPDVSENTADSGDMKAGADTTRDKERGQYLLELILRGPGRPASSLQYQVSAIESAAISEVLDASSSYSQLHELLMEAAAALERAETRNE